MREASSFCVALRRSRDAPGCGADELDRKNVEPAGNAGVRLNDKIISIGQSIGQNLAERENVMKTKRLWWTICTLFARSGGKRADYARKKNIYAHVGKNVAIHPWVIPADLKEGVQWPGLGQFTLFYFLQSRKWR